jgi:hypothetical protein
MPFPLAIPSTLAEGDRSRQVGSQESLDLHASTSLLRLPAPVLLLCVQTHSGARLALAAAAGRHKAARTLDLRERKGRTYYWSGATQQGRKL